MEFEIILLKIKDLGRKAILLGIKIEDWKQQILEQNQKWNLNLNIETKPYIKKTT
jgi:hypothetical protein